MVVVKRVMVHAPGDLIPHLGEKFQLVSADCIEEILFASLLSLRSFERGTNRAKTLGGELLLRLAGTHQISEAIRLRGVKVGPHYLVVFGGEEEARAFIERFGLEELPPEHCEGKILKPLMEKAALVETI